ncbi:MAG TPA: hypothetical protein VIL85_25685 [Thermomicrobiales bacterium]|jgi:hypothetical protein
MQPLTIEDVAAINDGLIESAPGRLLLNIARQGARYEYQLVSELTRWLPSQLPERYGRTWIAALLDWSRARGDIERDRRNRFSCLPPYLIGEVQNGAPSALILCGDPRIENTIRHEMTPLGIAIEHKLVLGRVRGDALEDDAAVEMPLGIERVVRARAGMRTPIEEAFARLGVTILRPDDLADSLPSLDLLVPMAAEHPPQLLGIWERYDPTILTDTRWLGVSEWSNSPAGLVRWRPSSDWQGERIARVFYHHGNGEVAELSHETASLWQLQLDRAADNTRVCWSAGTTFYVPGILPTAVFQWLRLLAGPIGPARFQRGWFVAPLDATNLSRAHDILSSLYGLRPQDGSPPQFSVGGRKNRR